MKNRTTIISAAVAIVLAALILSSFRGETPRPLRTEQMILDWERAHSYTMEYINAASDEAINFKPSPEMRTFAQQMLHLADGTYGLIALASGKPGPTGFGELEKRWAEFQTKAALAKAVSESYLYAIKSLKEIDDTKLNEVIPVFKYSVTREATFNKAFEHQTHHRGQTTVYLRLKGITPPSEKLF